MKAQKYSRKDTATTIKKNGHKHESEASDSLLLGNM